MPLFEYQCDACGGRFEALLKSAADKPGACPDCGSRKVKRQLSAFSPGASVPAGASCRTGECAARSSCPTGACPFGS
jgi:putative FmdB family regulatory protein